MKKLVALVLLGLFSGCMVNVDFDYETFLAQRQAWNDLNISHYSYAYYSSGVFLDEYLYIVSNDLVIWTTNMNDPSGAQTNWFTIDYYFDLIEDLYLGSQGTRGGLLFANNYTEWIDVVYDPVYHYPVSVTWEKYNSPFLLGTGNTSWSITAFTNL